MARLQFACDPVTGDLDLSGGRTRIVDSLRQRIFFRLQFIRGEWFLDRGAGVPYYTQIFVRGPDLPLVRGAIRNAIVETDGVRVLNSLELVDFDRTSRMITIRFRVNNDDEDVEEEIQI